MNAIEKILAPFGRCRDALLPTPVHELVALSEMSGCRVFCKRDDLTGFGFGGNKARKLDFLICEALRGGCDTLVAVGANQSNFCRMAAAYGRVHNMEVHLVLGGPKPENPTGNLRLDHILGARCHHLNSALWDEWEAGAVSLEASLKKKGRKVYRMPIGGSTPTGAMGYVSAMSEIMDDERRLGIKFGAIVFASSSAGTQTGLVVGQAIAKWPGQVIGFSVADKKNRFEAKVFSLVEATGRILDARVDRESIIVDDSFLGRGYARKTMKCQNAVHFFARRCGIFLDYVYTGKAAAGLLEYLREGCFKPGTAVLFLHTGGNAELFE